MGSDRDLAAGAAPASTSGTEEENALPLTSTSVLGTDTAAVKALRLTRELLLSGELQREALLTQGVDWWTDEQLDASLEATLAARPRKGDLGEDIWLFGYGSLIWNPAIHYAERKVARIRGWHRRFCLWTYIGRGDPQTPGIVLGLLPGGSCIGTVYRITGATARLELSAVWRREMLSGAYLPRWVNFATADGHSGTALTFTVNRSYPRFANRLSSEQIAQSIAVARGHFGRCADYFFATVRALEEMGIHDPKLLSLYERVLQILKDQDQFPIPEAPAA